jgi:nitrate/nitrite-specific signal transduction histidine kinase
VTAELTGNHQALGQKTITNFIQKLLSHFLDVQSLLNAAPDAMTNYQARELVAVDEHDSLAQLLGCLTCRR